MSSTFELQRVFYKNGHAPILLNKGDYKIALFGISAVFVLNAIVLTSLSQNYSKECNSCTIFLSMLLKKDKLKRTIAMSSRTKAHFLNEHALCRLFFNSQALVLFYAPLCFTHYKKIYHFHRSTKGQVK